MSEYEISPDKLDAAWERLNIALYTLGLNKSELSRQLGISRQCIHALFKKKRRTAKSFNCIMIKYAINPRWLWYGDDAMFMEAHK